MGQDMVYQTVRLSPVAHGYRPGKREALDMASACEHPSLYLCVPSLSTQGVHVCSGRIVLALSLG